VKQKQIYSDGNAVERGKGQERAASAGLLGSIDQYCASFYHVEATSEGDISELCLSTACGRQPCPRKTVVAVARVHKVGLAGGAHEDIYVARYSNCFKGSSESNVHAEHFMLADPGLTHAIQGATAALRGGGSGGQRDQPAAVRLTLYMTYQPCHHSGGHNRRGMGEHGTSCTELICKYLRDVLAPLGIALELKITYLYRAHWEAGAYDSKYAPAVEAARKGLRLLSDAGIACSACKSGDWEWLIGLCDETVREAWRDAEYPFGLAPTRQRIKMDSFIDSFLQRLDTGTRVTTADVATAESQAVATADVAIAHGDTMAGSVEALLSKSQRCTLVEEDVFENVCAACVISE